MGVGANQYVTGIVVISGTNNALYVANSAYIVKDVYSNNSIIANNTTTKILQVNTSANTTNLSYVGTLTGANGIINIGSGKIYKDATGNVGIGTTTPFGIFNVVNNSANDCIRINQSGSGNALFVSGKTSLTGQANTTNDLGVGGNQYVTGNQVITGTTKLTGQANTTNDLGVGGDLYANGNIVITGTNKKIIADNDSGGATITANAITVGTGGLTVKGSFTVTGTTVYDTTDLVLGTSTSNQTIKFGSYRKTGSVLSNSYIRWNETSGYWDLTANSALPSQGYYRILSSELLSDSYTSSSTSNVATALAVSSLKTYTDSTFVKLTGSTITGDITISTANINFTGSSSAKDITGADTISSNTLSLQQGSIWSNTVTLVNNNTDQVLDMFANTSFRTAKYLIQHSSGSNYQSSEILLIHNGLSSNIVEYGTVSTTGSFLASFNTDVNSGNVRLLITPTLNASTNTKFIRTLISQ